MDDEGYGNHHVVSLSHVRRMGLVSDFFSREIEIQRLDIEFYVPRGLNEAPRVSPGFVTGISSKQLLVGGEWLPFGWFSQKYIGFLIIIPIDELTHIFQRGGPTTNQIGFQQHKPTRMCLNFIGHVISWDLSADQTQGQNRAVFMMLVWTKQTR